MKTHPGLLTSTLLALGLLVSPTLAADEPPPRGETLETRDNSRIAGRLEGDPKLGFQFLNSRTQRAVPLEPGMIITGPATGPPAATGSPPFALDLGLGQRLSGRLVSINDREVRLLDLAGHAHFSIARAGLLSIVQRPGESLVFQDGFETIDATRWNVIGEPDSTGDLKIAGDRSLSLVAGGASLTHRLERPFGSGRLEVAFHDNRVVVPGQQWFVDLTFRSFTGQQTVRVVLGWAEESLAVESSPGSPALAVQRLARTAGWHRLIVRFGSELCEISVDGNELAHGKGLGGPLVEVRVASFQAGKEGPPDDLAGHLDDLRLVRFDEPSADVETDVTQDEIRLTGGDQIFGAIGKADAETIEATVDGRKLTLGWGEVSGLYFHRASTPGVPIEGQLVHVEWRAGPAGDPRDLNQIDGALTGLSATELQVATPYAGVLAIPRSRLARLTILERARRLVLDVMPHHLGDEVSATEPILDPPQPEGGVLERAFSLADVPEGPAFLVLDVVQVVGETAEVPFASRVKKGELRTNVKINGEPFDYLNRYITSANETPERIRLPIPRGALKPGRNVLRFEQAGIESDPNYLDDLGILGITVDVPIAAETR